MSVAVGPTMTNTLSRIALVALTAVAMPAVAAAQTFITPYAGVATGGEASGKPLTFGGSLLFVKQVGLELDFGYSPDFYGERSDLVLVGDSNVASLMANIVIAPGGGPVRPYAAAGAGLLRSRVDGGTFFNDLTTNSFGVNAGAGVIVMLGRTVGLRGDVRYFRALEDPERDDEFDLALGRLDFWRATLGVAFRF
jgi:hypothetical protein